MKNALILNQILSTILKRNLWRSVWRICMWILGLKGLKVLKTAKLPKNDDNRETGIKIQCCYLKIQCRDHIFVFTEHLYVICPYLVAVVSSEYFVDWIKHAFITKFNNIPVEVSIYMHSFYHQNERIQNSSSFCPAWGSLCFLFMF